MGPAGFLQWRKFCLAQNLEIGRIRTHKIKQEKKVMGPAGFNCRCAFTHTRAQKEGFRKKAQSLDLGCYLY